MKFKNASDIPEDLPNNMLPTLGNATATEIENNAGFTKTKGKKGAFYFGEEKESDEESKRAKKILISKEYLAKKLLHDYYSAKKSLKLSGK